jgi:hypothetical protein
LSEASSVVAILSLKINFVRFELPTYNPRLLMVYYPSHHRLPFLACYGVWVGQEVSTTELLLLKHKACRAFLTPEREKEKKKKKAWPRSTTTNTRASQLIIIDGVRIVNFVYIYKFDS